VCGYLSFCDGVDSEELIASSDAAFSSFFLSLRNSPRYTFRPNASLGLYRELLPQILCHALPKNLDITALASFEALALLRGILETSACPIADLEGIYRLGTYPLSRYKV